MNLLELENLLDEIRNGRSEDTALDWKKKWWDFSIDKGRSEFLKDIAAMANANTRDRRIFVIGVNSEGIVEDTPLPEDEANLQQRLHAITPIPHVSFKVITLPANQRISIIEICDPLDKPYVVRAEGKNIIYVRQGSTTTTATRAMLDRWYQEKVRPPELFLKLDGCVVEDGQNFVFERKLLVPPPRPRGVMFAPPLLKASPEEAAALLNHVFWLALEIRNDGSTPAENIVADFEISGLRKLEIYTSELEPRSASFYVSSSPTWPTDPNENCYVESYSVRGGTGRARQRVKRINPGLEEPFVELGFLAQEVTAGAPLHFSVRCDVTEGRGVRLTRTFNIEVKFHGEQLVTEKAEA